MKRISDFRGVSRVFAACVVFCMASALQADSSVEPKDFVDLPPDRLSERRVIEFILRYKDVPYVKVVNLDGDPDPAKKLQAVRGDLFRLKKQLKASPPYTVAQLKKFYPTDKTDTATYDERSDWRKVVPVTAPFLRKEIAVIHEKGGVEMKTLSGSIGEVDTATTQLEESYPEGTVLLESRSRESFGPFQLRRKLDAIVEDDDSWVAFATDPDPEVTTVEGARLSYSNNFLEDGNGAWSTEGALIWPYHGIHRFSPSNTLLAHAALATSWKIEEQEKAGATDVNELMFSLPLAMDWMPGGRSYESAHRASQWILQANPFLQTDTDFDGLIWGGTASLEYRGYGAIPIGNYVKLGRFLGRDVKYRIRATALADYSEVHRGSQYISRTEGSDWFRLGGETGFNVGFFDPDKKQLPIVLGATYRYMGTVSGEGGDGDLFKANLSWWFSPYVGLSVDYENGETPVADKEVDLLTIGLQVRY